MNPAICHLIYPAMNHIKAAGIEPAISRFRRERDTTSLHPVHDKGPLGVEPSSCRLTGGRNPGHAKNPLLPITTKSGWRESNPRVSGWKPDAFPLGDTRIVGPEGVEPSSSRVRGACSASRATDPKSGRSENRTHHARERAAGLRPAGPPLVTFRPCDALHGRKESNPQLRVLEARALTDGASAVDGAPKQKRPGSFRHPAS